jgi:hypothetical protein
MLQAEAAFKHGLKKSYGILVEGKNDHPFIQYENYTK